MAESVESMSEKNMTKNSSKLQQNLFLTNPCADGFVFAVDFWQMWPVRLVTVATAAAAGWGDYGWPMDPQSEISCEIWENS